MWRPPFRLGDNEIRTSGMGGLAGRIFGIFSLTRTKGYVKVSRLFASSYSYIGKAKIQAGWDKRFCARLQAEMERLGPVTPGLKRVSAGLNRVSPLES